MWINDSTGYIFLSLAVLIVGWMSIFYIRINIVKNDDSQVSRVEGSPIKISTANRSARKMDENAITQKRRL